MNPVLNRLVAIVHNYNDFNKQQRAKRFFLICWVAIALHVVWLLYLVLSAVLTTIEIPTLAWLAPLLSIGVVIAFLELMQRGNLNFAARGLVALTLADIAVQAGIGLTDYPALLLIIPIVVASALLHWRGIVVTYILVCIVLFQNVVIVNQSLVSTVIYDPLLDFVFLVGFYLLVTGFLLINNLNMHGSLALLANMHSHFTSLVKQPSPMEEDSHPVDMIANTVRILKDNLGYSFVQAYLYQADGSIAYHIYSSLGIVQIVANSNIVHTEDSPYQQAIQTRKPQSTRREYQQWVATESVTLRSSTIIPLVDDDHAIGILEVQSATEIDPYEIESLVDLATLLTRTYLLATETIAAIDQITQQQTSIEQLQKQLETLTSTVADTDWLSAFQKPGQVRGYNIDGNSGQIVRADDLADDLSEVLNTPNYTIDIDEATQEGKLSIPIRLGDIVLGAFSLKMPHGKALTKYQIELIENVTQRLAIALQAQRLFQQSQSQAERERKANEISRQFLSSTDIRSILQLAADNLNESLGAIQTRIHLEPKFFTHESREMPQVEEELSQ